MLRPSWREMPLMPHGAVNMASRAEHEIVVGLSYVGCSPTEMNRR